MELNKDKGENYKGLIIRVFFGVGVSFSKTFPRA